LIFAGHHKLDNLTFIVDANGLQGFGTTRDVANLEPLPEKFGAFGMAADEVDGHDLHALVDALTRTGSAPRAVVARTVKGRGVSFMENKMEWHYLPLTESQYRLAIDEVNQPCATPFAVPS
jgi:transketolase